MEFLTADDINKSWAALVDKIFTRFKFMPEEKDNDPVNHPDHYNAHPSGVECIDIVEHMNFNLGNAMKYIWRAGSKGQFREDLEKAKWYIDRELERVNAVPKKVKAVKPYEPFDGYQTLKCDVCGRSTTACITQNSITCNSCNSLKQAEVQIVNPPVMTIKCRYCDKTTEKVHSNYHLVGWICGECNTGLGAFKS